MSPPPRRNDGRVILHFDYDCFYASVFEAEQPALRSLPLAVQQKQIIVTCNYEARRRGLHKLQLITDAKRLCPDVHIVLGEDLTRFRDASKSLFNHLRAYSWNGRCEKLGFDEVFMDVTDIVEFNLDLLNPNDLNHSFLQLDRKDPTVGFDFDASDFAGHTYPANTHVVPSTSQDDIRDDALRLRLLLASHLARRLRHRLEEELGYTSTVGISTTKLISKLVGNVNKPKGQTTMLPPYDASDSNVIAFMDQLDIGAVPGIGFKTSQRLRAHVLGHAAHFDDGLIYGATKENVTVGRLRRMPGLSSDMLEKLLAGPGMSHGIGAKVYALLYGVDDSDVAEARGIPSQISIEDSYIHLDTLTQVQSQLVSLSTRLVQRMRVDLTDIESDGTKEAASHEIEGPPPSNSLPSIKWLAHPETLRLTTRPRLPLNPDGTRIRSFKRISRSTPLPMFLLNLREDVSVLVDRLVRDVWMPLFRKLHPEKAGWNLSLVNVAVTNMVHVAGESRFSTGRDIAKMFKRQDQVLDDFRVLDDHPHDNAMANEIDDDDDTACQNDVATAYPRHVDGSGRNVSDDMEHTRHREQTHPTQEHVGEEGTWEYSSDADDDDALDDVHSYPCPRCGSAVPNFARAAHERFHALEGAC